LTQAEFGGQREGVEMKKLHHDYKVIPYSKLRRVLEIMYPSVQRKPMIHGLLEVDVTKAREFLRDHKAKTGESLSFTAFIITCFAHALAENPSLNACRKGSKQLILFDEVDVATPIERDMTGQKQPIIYCEYENLPRDSFRDSGGPGRTGGKGLGGLPRPALAAVRAAVAYQNLLVGLLLDAADLSPGAEEVRWDCGHLGSGDVRERWRLGHPDQ
jgi:hypothetical protein